MRVLVAAAIVIATAVSVTACFHHQEQVYTEPLKLN
jgi:hypothetical protein